MQRLFPVRDQHILDAFRLASAHWRRLVSIGVAVISLFVFAMFFTGQVKTFEDQFVLERMMLFPVFLVIMLFYFGIMRPHPSVLRGLLSFPSSLFAGVTLSFVVLIVLFFVLGSLLPETSWSGSVDPLLLVIQAVAEEVLYRFALFYSVASLLNRPIAVVVSSLLFGIVHPGVGLFLVATFFGVAFALLTIRSGSLFPACCFHIIFNAVAYLK